MWGMGMGMYSGMGMGMGMGFMPGMSPGMVPPAMGGIGYGTSGTGRGMMGGTGFRLGGTGMGVNTGVGMYSPMAPRYDPLLAFGATPASIFVDDDPDVHRVEHAYRQSAPDSYGIGLGMMSGLGGMQGINNLPGAPRLLYGRGVGPMGGWF